MTLVLLDWEKAFDKINQSKLLQVLRRLKTPQNMLRLVTHMYAHPKFRITTEGISSRYRRQEDESQASAKDAPYHHSYLYFLWGPSFKISNPNSTHQSNWNPLKAYDMQKSSMQMILWFLGQTQSINIFLHAIQRESSYYNLNLNYDKCINLTLHQKQSTVKYLDGTLVPRKHEAIYLGTLLSDSANNQREVLNRLAAAMATCNRLKVL